MPLRSWILSSLCVKLRMEVSISALWGLTHLGGDLLSRCVPDIKECGPSWNVSSEIHIDCQDFNESYSLCKKGNSLLSREMFVNECRSMTSGKKESTSFLHPVIHEVCGHPAHFLQATENCSEHLPDIPPVSKPWGSEPFTECHFCHFGMAFLPASILFS